MSEEFVALDLETTGLSQDRDAIIEIAALRFRGGRALEEFQTLVRPAVQIPLRVQQLTGLGPADFGGAPDTDEALARLAEFVGDRPLVGQSVGHDLAFLRRAGLSLKQPAFDTFELATIVLPRLGRYSLAHLLAHFDLEIDEPAHRALADTRRHWRLFLALEASVDALPPALLAAIAALAAAAPGWGLGPVFAAAWARARARGADERPAAVAEPAPEPELAPAPAPAIAFEPAALAALLAPGGRLEALAPDHYEDRPGQQVMSRAVAEALGEGDRLLVEAGTGIGKSLAYLLPAAAWAMHAAEPVVIATHTVALQEQLVGGDVPLVGRLLGREPRVAVLKGRSHYLCRARWRRLLGEPSADPLRARFCAKVLVWLAGTRTGDRAEILLQPDEQAMWRRVSAEGGCGGPDCEAEGPGGCWLARARRRAAAADLVIVNQALLLASGAREGGPLLPPFSRLVVDEAHHLEETATGALGFGLDRGGLDARLAELQGEDGLLRRALRLAGDGAGSAQEAAARAQAAVEAARGEGAAFFVTLDHALAEQPGGRHQGELRFTESLKRRPAWLELEMAAERALDRLRAVEERVAALGRALPPAAGGVLARAMEVVDGLASPLERSFLRPRRDEVFWAARSDGGRAALHGAPRDVARHLEERVYLGLAALVLTSATLRAGDDFEFLRDRLGLHDAASLVVEPPFDYRRALLACLPRDMPAPNEPDYQPALDRAIIGLAAALGGRTLVLFTSYAGLKRSYHAIRQPLGELGIAVLGQGIDGARHQLIDTFRRREHPTVLLGTRSFWEGVDLPGEALVAVVIARLPFDVPSDPVFQARAELFDDGFAQYTAPQSVLRFRQGIGRLIRSRSDRGVAVILDSRIHHRSYGQLFQDALPEGERFEGYLADLPERARLFLESSPEPALG